MKGRCKAAAAAVVNLGGRFCHGKYKKHRESEPRKLPLTSLQKTATNAGVRNRQFGCPRGKAASGQVSRRSPPRESGTATERLYQTLKLSEDERIYAPANAAAGRAVAPANEAVARTLK
jgi:hypothetical protein